MMWFHVVAEKLELMMFSEDQLYKFYRFSESNCSDSDAAPAFCHGNKWAVAIARRWR